MTNPELKSLIERIETLETEKAETAELIKEIYSEAASSGFDKKILRKVIAIRRIEKAEREEVEQLVQTYLESVEE
jgi:uncharacterized protein (UPF0335 family)